MICSVSMELMIDHYPFKSFVPLLFRKSELHASTLVPGAQRMGSSTPKHEFRGQTREQSYVTTCPMNVVSGIVHPACLP
jgi:hypothetical protein